VAASRDFDPLVDKAPARYVVGIDLGTTNSAVMYVDASESPWKVRPLTVPQLVATGQVEARDTLPSFHFQPLPHDVADGSLRLPWSQEDENWIVGIMARDEGMKSSGRLIASAKSWLCHTGVDRAAKLLPWHGADDVDRLSPVEASGRYLKHIRDAWNAKFPRDTLADQDIVITLPASFDEVARELTVEAAATADLPNVVLIEEPQAAFYAWVYKHDDDWPQLVSAGDTILVCDIGGGTSDFTLIKVRQTESKETESKETESKETESKETEPKETEPKETEPTETDTDRRAQFHRVAVGDHLILGGDNLDMALAHYIEKKLANGGRLAPQQWDVLVRSCRRVKETLLGEEAPERATVNLPGSGSKLIGGGFQAEVSRDEVERLLVDGFLPRTALAEPPASGQSGFREFGLPFASDPAITRHLAAFLSAHGEVANTGSDAPNPSARPDIVLFNGGFFASPLLRGRLLEVIAEWFGDQSKKSWKPTVLDNDRLDLAVARGAAYYGMVRRGEGVRIAASLARSYYVEVDSDAEEVQAICLVPGHAEPGQDLDLVARTLELTISQPVEFSLFFSSTRLTDEPGDIVTVNREQMKPLPPIRTVLRTERRNETGMIPVTLHAHLSEIGTIDLWCQAAETDRRWRLQFDVRSATQTDIAAHEAAAEAEGIVDEATWQASEKLILDVFGKDGQGKPSALVKQLAATLGADRQEWPTSLLRRFWEALMALKEGRQRSPAHEARWLNLLGFSLRPGYGLAIDDWRVAETWRHVRGKLAHAGASQAESLILWRRISGGLSAGQQSALAEPLTSSLRAAHTISTTGKRSRGTPSIPLHESFEAWRLLGSLELLDVPMKVQLGNMIVDLVSKRKYEKVRSPMVWTLGRIGQRQPLYGPLNSVVPQVEAAKWCESLLQLSDSDGDTYLAAMQLSRRTHDRYRDMDEKLRERVVMWLNENNTSPHLVELVREGGTLESEEQDQVFGEALPKGLRMRGGVNGE